MLTSPMWVSSRSIDASTVIGVSSGSPSGSIGRIIERIGVSGSGGVRVRSSMCQAPSGCQIAGAEATERGHLRGRCGFVLGLVFRDRRVELDFLALVGR